MILNKKTLLIFLCLTTTLNNGQDKKACETFKQNLKIIKERLDKKKGLNLMKVSSAINFLEEVTKIVSHSNMDYAGRFDPTNDDYVNWTNWFKKNNLRLYWDSKEQKVKVKGAP